MSQKIDLPAEITMLPRPPEPAQPKMSFRNPWHLIECRLPEGWALRNPEGFWQAVREIHGVVEITSEGVYQFSVKASSMYEPYFYLKAIQDAARNQGRGYVQTTR